MIDPALLGPLLGSGQVAEVFAYGNQALKLYRAPEAKGSAFSEAGVLAAIAGQGLPVPEVHAVVQHAGRWGLVIDRAPGAPLAQWGAAGPELVPGALEEMLRLHRQMHAVTGLRLPDLRQRLRVRLQRGNGLPDDLRARLLDRLAVLPDGLALCHGDFHPFNVLGIPGSAMVIDWLDAASGAPTADVARTHLLVSAAAADLADAYVAAYCAGTALTADEIMAWLPVLAGARIATEGVDADEAPRLLAIAERIT